MARQKDTKPKSKMNRSETVSLRLDPRLNYLCEIAARSQRRTKSSFIEAAIAEKIQSMHTSNWRDRHEQDDAESIGERGDYLWSIHEWERLTSLGLAAPHLMTYEEQEIWTVIHKADCFWKETFDGGYGGGTYSRKRDEASVDRDLIEEHWGLVNQIANGEESKSKLPKPKQAKRAPEANGSGGFGQAPSFGGPDLDDEIPF